MLLVYESCLISLLKLAVAYLAGGITYLGIQQNAHRKRWKHQEARLNGEMGLNRGVYFDRPVTAWIVPPATSEIDQMKLHSNNHHDDSTTL